jgi:hypothetical protein
MVGMKSTISWAVLDLLGEEKKRIKREPFYAVTILMLVLTSFLEYVGSWLAGYRGSNEQAWWVGPRHEWMPNQKMWPLQGDSTVNE